MTDEPRTPDADDQPAEGEEPQAEPAVEPAPAPAEEPAAVEPAPAPEKEPAAVEEPAATEPAAQDAAAEEPAATEPAAEQPAAETETSEPAAASETPPAAPEQPTESAKPAIPGADLEVDIVPEGSDPLAQAGEAEPGSEFDENAPPAPDAADEPVASEAAPTATIDLAAGARYTATGKRKTAVARVILKPGKGEYTINGRPLDAHFPRPTLQRNIRQPLETVGYESRMDVVAKMHGGGVSAQAGALRHGISRALIEADPNLRGELKRRGFLTRDPRVKERKKAGLKKARKRPQFSKR